DVARRWGIPPDGGVVEVVNTQPRWVPKIGPPHRRIVKKCSRTGDVGANEITLNQILPYCPDSRVPAVNHQPLYDAVAARTEVALMTETVQFDAQHGIIPLRERVLAGCLLRALALTIAVKHHVRDARQVGECLDGPPAM